MEKTLPYGKYRFICRMESEARVPFFKGSTFRGLFGHALKRVVCALRLQECSQCLLRNTCLYSQVFEAPDSPVHPFVIEPPLDGERTFRPGDRFECSLLLFGPPNDRMPYFVYAFEQMGKIGMGGKVNGQRGRFVLEQVTSGDRTIYSEKERTLLMGETADLLRLERAEAVRGPRGTVDSGGRSGAESTKTMRVRVVLETPLRLKFENRLTADLPFHVLVRAALRRISTLFNTYGDGEPELDYKGLVREAEAVRIEDSTLRWFDWERYSNRQDTRMFMGGIMGSIAYEGDLGKYLPLLDLAAKVHVGKQTTFGMGKMRFEINQFNTHIPG